MTVCKKSALLFRSGTSKHLFGLHGYMLIFACMFFQLSEGCLMLNDTTGVVTIIGMNKLPQGCPPLNKGRILHTFTELGKATQCYISNFAIMKLKMLYFRINMFGTGFEDACDVACYKKTTDKT